MATGTVPSAHNPDVVAGARALRNLLLAIRDRSSADVAATWNEDGTSDDDHSDPRDYVLYAQLAEQSLMGNVVGVSAEHRAGYLRAFTDLLTCVADGTLPDDLEGWDPLATTEAAFVADRGWRAVLAAQQTR